MSKSADAFRTISEVADWLGVPAHVLRFWESKFTQVKPIKRAGGRRYYRPTDMLLIGGIKKLLHDDGLTIKGAQKLLRENGVAFVADMSQPLDDLTMAVLDVAPTANDVSNDIPDIIEAESNDDGLDVDADDLDTAADTPDLERHHHDDGVETEDGPDVESLETQEPQSAPIEEAEPLDGGTPTFDTAPLPVVEEPDATVEEPLVEAAPQEAPTPADIDAVDSRQHQRKKRLQQR